MVVVSSTSDSVLGGAGTIPQASSSTIPGFQYTPLVVDIIVSAVILVIAAILASIPKKPE